MNKKYPNVRAIASHKLKIYNPSHDDGMAHNVAIVIGHPVQVVDL